MTFKAKFALAILLFVASAAKAQTNNLTERFDDNWLFYRGAAQGAEDSAFADGKWKKIDLPHDWSIEDIPGTNSPFSINAVSQVNGGFTVGGIGWYRKSFTVPASQKDKKLFIQFDGVYMNAEVYLNGKRPGKHPYGYTSFWYNITERIRFGANNVLAVKVTNVGENSRWYSGSGIYRHVWLTTVAPIHVTPWGVSVSSEEVSAASAIVKAKTTVENEEKQAAEITLVTRIISTKGKEVATGETKQVIQPKASYTYTQEAVVKSPDLWSIESPSLYTAVTEAYRMVC